MTEKWLSLEEKIELLENFGEYSANECWLLGEDLKDLRNKGYNCQWNKERNTIELVNKECDLVVFNIKTN